MFIAIMPLRFMLHVAFAYIHHFSLRSLDDQWVTLKSAESSKTVSLNRLPHEAKLSISAMILGSSSGSTRRPRKAKHPRHHEDALS